MSTPGPPSSPAGTTSMSRIDLLTAALGEPRRIEGVEVQQVELGPRQPSARHLHPCPVIGLVLRGSVVFQLEGQVARVLEAGDAFFEPANATVSRFDAGREGATYVAHYLLGPDEQTLITLLPRGSRA